MHEYPRISGLQYEKVKKGNFLILRKKLESLENTGFNKKNIKLIKNKKKIKKIFKKFLKIKKRGKYINLLIFPQKN